MFLKRLTAATGAGRKQLFCLDNLLGLIFITIVLGFALGLDYFIFTYFCLGLLIVRVFEIIFEIKHDIFDRPFFHYLVLIGMPVQFLWSRYH